MFARFAFTSFLFSALPLAAIAADGDFCYDNSQSCGPDGWAALPIENNACGGMKNSPIAVTAKGAKCDINADYTLNAGTCGSANDLTYTMSSGGVKASYPDGCTKPSVKIPAPSTDETYHAAQFHIHLSSEHTIDGKFFGAELHVVHLNDAGSRAAVVGMMIDPTNDANHPEFDNLLAGWQAVASATEEACSNSGQTGNGTSTDGAGRKYLRELAERKLQSFNVYNLLESDSTFFHYDGGLTTPPCSEIVWWNLNDTPVKISVSQFRALTALILDYVDPDTCNAATVASPTGSTSRPPVPLNGRTVTRICPTGYKLEECGSSASTTSGAASMSLVGLAIASIVTLF